MKPPELPSDGDRRLGMATVWGEHRFPLVGFEGILLVLGVKASLQGSRRPAEIAPNATGTVHKGCERCGPNARLLLVDGVDRQWSEHKAVVCYDGELCVAWLVLMAGVAKALAPFCTPVLEPSPWSTEGSS